MTKVRFFLFERLLCLAKFSFRFYANESAIVGKKESRWSFSCWLLNGLHE